jgi:hypothetical protein
MIEVLKQALEALYPISHNSTDDYRGQADKAITSLRQAIAELESQEPVAALWQHGETGRFRVTAPDSITDCDARWFKVGDLYLRPPQRPRVVFPTMLRKMWSGGEVQAWLDENVNKEKNNA